VNAGLRTHEVPDGDSTTTKMHIYATIEYGDCKRCGTTPENPDRREEHMLTFFQPVLETFSFDGESVTTKFSQRVEEAP
jgi:hypothetical protein